MSGKRAERAVVLTMRLLVAAFAVTGVLFIVTPDGVIDTLGDVGDALGGFAPGADSDQRLWLGLAFAYMVVITGIALVVQSDVARFRPLLLVLAAGKAASSLAAGAYFVFEDDVFAYLVNFVVDGGLVVVALACWALARTVTASRPSAAVGEQAGAPAPAHPPETGGDRPAGAGAARG